MAKLFTPLKLREITFRNRVFVSPMCQYSSEEGCATDWHLVHLGSRAVGGAGLVMVEATGVSAIGRISSGDSGLWNDQQAASFKKIASFIREQGAVPAIQLAHAGRKASTDLPWRGGKPLPANAGGWNTIAPSAIAFDSNYSTPTEMSREQIAEVQNQFVKSARYALEIGFDVIEIHMAHGYLLHEFLSPLSNQRTDEFGGALENRMRFPLQIAKALRELWPAKLPVFVRISASDWVDGGWDIESSLALCEKFREIGIDLVDCSSGGVVPRQTKMVLTPGYQVPFAEEIRRKIKIPTGAVGLITDPHQAEEILVSEKADVIFLARELLRHPYWSLHAAHALKANVEWPKQYERAKPK